MKVSVSYEPTGYMSMSNKRVLLYVIGGAIACIAIIGAMFYHHGKIDPVALLIGIAIFAAVSICGYVMKLNTRFCWNNDIFTVLNITGGAEKEFNWDDLNGFYTNDTNKHASLVFNVNGKNKEIEFSMNDDGYDQLCQFLQSKTN